MSTTLVKINGVAISTPSSYKATTEDLVDSARNQDGVVIGAVIRQDVAKIELSWKYLEASKWSDILKMFSAKHGGSFYNMVEFYDMVSGTFVIRNMYIGHRNADMHQLDKQGQVQGFLNCRLALIEV